MKRSKIGFALLLFMGACGTPADSDDNGILTGEFARVYAEPNQILIRNATVAGEAFGDSLVLIVNGQVRHGGSSIALGDVPVGSSVSGRIETVCLDENPRLCAVDELFVE